MMKKIHTLLIALLMLVFTLNTNAEEIKIKAQLDSSIILIGDQVKLQLEIEYPSELEILFPIPKDSLSEFVEIIERLPLDTISLENNRKSMSQEFIVTSFDTGHHQIPPFEFAFSYNEITDTAASNPTLLHVFTLPKIDSLMNAMKGPIDIKAPYEAPVSFKEVAPWLLGTLLAAALIFLILYAIRRKKNNQPLFSFPQKPKEPAHIIALRKLDHIKEEKVWQQGNSKQYYSDLTNTLREYIQNRFNIRAIEQTSDETIAAFKKEKGLLNEVTFSNMERILTNADLVKFAKYEPLPDDNNLALVDAFFFVNQTKIEIQKEAEEIDDDSEGEEVLLK
ncbi:MAG: hypothetical protein PF541_14305 [Prolixibacteraceae bacterium]|jgi:hypothetical protein|nr:hypothetical protein [Prolixibacteraceae bacterium]